MVRDYIFLASGCLVAGLLITLIVFGVCQRLGIDISENLWVTAIPVVSSLILNITLLELYHKYRKRK